MRDIAFAVLSVSLLLAGCDVRVRHSGRDEARGRKDVDVRTPFGGLSVSEGTDAQKVGIPVYAGARPLRDRGESNADVSISAPFFDLDVSASKYATGDAPSAVLAFYRTELAKFGPVTECQGDVDFRGRRGERLRCRERWFEDETQLAVGSADHHRIVTVKKRGNGSEFALVHIDTRRDFD